VDYIVTSVPATKDVEELLKGPDGIFKNARKGTIVVDTSTISPLASKEFAAEAKKKEIVFVDSPMSGGITGAQAGTLTFMVGCDKEHFEAVKHVLTGMGKNVFHCGGPGTGEIAKICNNLILGINMIALSEGLSLGEKLGIDPKILSSIISVSTGRSWCVDTYNPRPNILENVPSSRDYNGGFQVSLIRKDLSIALEAA
jgi:3-hydroxyisobutyrate dehydrogenase